MGEPWWVFGCLLYGFLHKLFDIAAAEAGFRHIRYCSLYDLLYICRRELFGTGGRFDSLLKYLLDIITAESRGWGRITSYLSLYDLLYIRTSEAGGGFWNTRYRRLYYLFDLCTGRAGVGRCGGVSQFRAYYALDLSAGRPRIGV